MIDTAMDIIMCELLNTASAAGDREPCVTMIVTTLRSLAWKAVTLWVLCV